MLWCTFFHHESRPDPLPPSLTLSNAMKHEGNGIIQPTSFKIFPLWRKKDTRAHEDWKKCDDDDDEESWGYSLSLLIEYNIHQQCRHLIVHSTVPHMQVILEDVIVHLLTVSNIVGIV